MIRILGFSKKKNIQIEIHPHAKTAFDFFISIEKLFCLEKLSPNFSAFFSKSMTLHAIEIDSKILVISGFEHAAFDLTKTDFTKINILLHEADLCINEIIEIAWSGVSEKIHSSISMKSLGHFMNQTNEKIPPEILKQLYYNTHLSEPKLARLVSVTRGCIANQRQKIRGKQPEKVQISKNDILQEMRESLLG